MDGAAVGYFGAARIRTTALCPLTHMPEPAHTRAQLAALAPRLVPGSLLHSCWFSAELADFCEQQGMRALEYAEQVHDHWYPGARAALAVMPGPAAHRRMPG